MGELPSGQGFTPSGDPRPPEDPLETKVLQLPWPGIDNSNHPYKKEVLTGHASSINELLEALHGEEIDRSEHPVIATFGSEATLHTPWPQQNYQSKLADTIVAITQQAGLRVEVTTDGGYIASQTPEEPAPPQPSPTRVRDLMRGANPFRRNSSALPPQMPAPDYKLKIGYAVDPNPTMSGVGMNRVEVIHSVSIDYPPKPAAR